MVKHIIEICQEVGVKSIAEGVANEKQLNLLKEFRCDYAQGFYYDKPIERTAFKMKYMEKTI